MSAPIAVADGDVDAGIARLSAQLPLQMRQRALSAELQRVHRTILHTLAQHGRVPTPAEIARQTADAGAALECLSRDDLIVVNTDGTFPVGAYPMTTEHTPYQLRIGTHRIYAMCALDALAVAPMFECEVEIASCCHVTGEAVDIHQRNMEILRAAPSPEVRVGIRWQMPVGCAAHSMCREMVFLRDPGTAVQWQSRAPDNSSLFTLDQAAVFAARFFLPLLHD